ncbi:MAG: hypothetical protein RL032_1103 [Pseudomonadota bacterium]|jgi:hypothetical protein
MSASVGLIALWTGELCANVEHIRHMAIHQMSEEDLAQFAKFVFKAEQGIQCLAKYVKEQREAA